MRIVTAAVMASTLAVSSLSHAAEVGSGDNWHPVKNLRSAVRRAMFDGISLTEHQRQQMRDSCNRPGTNSLLLMLANRRQCIALSLQKILMKTLRARTGRKNGE